MATEEVMHGGVLQTNNDCHRTLLIQITPVNIIIHHTFRFSVKGTFDISDSREVSPWKRLVCRIEAKSGGLICDQMNNVQNRFDASLLCR